MLHDMRQILNIWAVILNQLPNSLDQRRHQYQVIRRSLYRRSPQFSIILSII